MNVVPENLVKQFRSTLLDLLYPPTCCQCHRDLDWVFEGLLICGDCLEELAVSSGIVCTRCGASETELLGNGGGCVRCFNARFSFDSACALGSYEGLLRTWILQIKHSGHPHLSRALAELLWQSCRSDLAAARPEVVVPVPSHWTRRFVRKTNSPSVVASFVAEKLGVPLAKGLLCRTRNTPPQATLPPSQRLGNVRNVFRCRTGYVLKNARVLLVDDILTTGATCSEAAKELKRSGASTVTVVVLGRANARS